jgi:hypothetical protein
LRQSEPATDDQDVAGALFAGKRGRLAAGGCLWEDARPSTVSHDDRVVLTVAPVTKQSGRTRIVQRRRACHHDVQQAMFYAGGERRAALQEPVRGDARAWLE